MLTFTNKIVTVENSSISTSPLTNIKNRISTDLYHQFSNLHFAGVYSIGNPNNKRECYIGSGYNVTLKVTHQMNLLYRGEHHSKGLQEWVNANGIEALDICLLRRCKPFPDEFEKYEQYYLNLIKPKFNAILNKVDINVEIGTGFWINVYINTKHKNEFGNPIVTAKSVRATKQLLNITSKVIDDDERKQLKPTIIICVDGTEDVVINRGKKTAKAIEKTTVVETVVVRKNVFNTSRT